MEIFIVCKHFEVTLRQNMTEELSLNDDPDSLMIEETSTLGLPNISDITRFKIDFELPAGKIHIFQISQLQLVTTFADFCNAWFVLLGSTQNKRNNVGSTSGYHFSLA